MNKLDDLKQIKATDKEDMAKFIEELPTQIKKSFEKMAAVKLPEKYHEIKSVCFCGIGGSASAADIFLNQNFGDHKMPIALVRDGELPGWADKNTLVILISHSGVTAETMTAFKEAAARETKIIVICERGDLENWAKAEGAVVLDYDTQAAPRAALGYQFGLLAGLNNLLNLGPKINLEKTLKILEKLNSELKPETPTEKNMAKHLAFSLFDHEPKIIGSGILDSVARRWKNQFNENAKTFASFDSLPEAMHNAVEGTTFPKRLTDDSFFILLKNSLGSKLEIKALDAWTSLLQEKNIPFEFLEATGEDVWSQKLSLIILGDWVSFYLAILNNVDSTPVPIITKYK